MQTNHGTTGTCGETVRSNGIARERHFFERTAMPKQIPPS